MSDDQDEEHGPETTALAEALRHLRCADGFIYHGHVLGPALPAVAAAIVDHMTDRGWTPPPTEDDPTDHLRIDRTGISAGGNPIPAPVDRSTPLVIRRRDEHATVDVRLIALAGISADDDSTSKETHPDGTITVRWKDEP